MPSTNIISIDGAVGTALLIVRDDSAVELTRFTFSNASGGSVTLSARPFEVTLPREKFERTAADLESWRGLIENMFSLIISGWVDFDEVYFGRTNTIRAIFRLNGTEQTDNKYFRLTNLFVLQPRPQRVFDWAEFNIWQRSQRTFLSRCA